MDKATSIGKTSATGSFQLLIGVVGSTIILALGTLILGWVLTRDQLGLYGIVLIPISMVNFFRDWGVNSAMTKEIARLRTVDKKADIHEVIVSGVVFEIISGAILTITCALLSATIASYLRVPDSSALILISSFSIFLSAISAAATNIFVGFEKMNYNSLTTIVSAIVKTVAGPLLVIVGYGVLGAVWAYTISFAASSVIGIAIVYFALYRPLLNFKKSKCQILKTLKPMLNYGIPLTISNAIIGVLPQVFAFMMARYAGPAIMGDFYAALYFTVLLTFFTYPIMTALFPVFAKINPEGDKTLLGSIFVSSVKYASIILAPATLALIALANPMVNALFPNKFPNAPMFLSLYVLSSLYTLAGNISMGEFLTGIGASTQLMKQNLLSLVVALPFAFAVIPFIGESNQQLVIVVGIVGIVLSSLPGLVWGLHWIWSRYGLKTNFRSSAKLLVSSLASALAVFIFLSTFEMTAWFQLIFGFAVFMVIYTVTTPLIGAIEKDDVDNIREMFSSIRLVSVFLSVPLKIFEETLKVRGKLTKH